MKIAVFSTQAYDKYYFDRANEDFGFELCYFENILNTSQVSLAEGFKTVCVFVNDQLNADVIDKLYRQGTQHVALRCAGFNNVDIEVASKLGVCVSRVPKYSPHAVAEHAMGLMLCLNRKIHRAFNRVREGNFSLNGLVGFDLAEKTVGIIGTGQIGCVLAKILVGFNCRVIAYDIKANPDCEAAGVKYVDLDTLYGQSDIISLHCPLTPETHHLIDAASIGKMRDGVMLINTSRGAITDAKALIQGLKAGKIGYLGLDVYEQEGDIFYHDLSDQIIDDDTFERLLTFPNVLVTGHQAFLTHDALTSIANTTLENIRAYATGKACLNAVTSQNFEKS